MTLLGLMSRWIRPTPCASQGARQTCRRKWIARAGGSGPCCATSVFEVHARQVLHDVVERAVLGVAVVEDLDGVRVRQRRHRPHLALEALSRFFGSPRLVRADQLDGAGPAQQAVLGQVDLAHAAGPQQLLEVVLAQLAAPRGPAPATPGCDTTRTRRRRRRRPSAGRCRTAPSPSRRRGGRAGRRPGRKPPAASGRHSAVILAQRFQVFGMKTPYSTIRKNQRSVLAAIAQCITCHFMSASTHLSMESEPIVLYCSQAK